MNYIYSISQAMLKWSQQKVRPSNPIVISAIRDLLVLAESQYVNKIMVRTASDNQNEPPYHMDDLISSLKDTNRDIQDVLKSIEYLQQNIGQSAPVSPSEQREIAQKTAYRLAQLRDEAVIIKDYDLAFEIDNIFDAIGLLT